MRINVLDGVFVVSEVLLQQAKVVLALIDEVGNDFGTPGWLKSLPFK